jgi:two-component system chemotaxis response regulator CheB
MDGLTFLKKLMHFRPLPTVVISSLAQTSCRAAVDALQAGAVEVLSKPGGPYSVGELRRTLADKIRAAAASRVRRMNLDGAQTLQETSISRQHNTHHPGSVIAMGASTGGTEAIAAILKQLPASAPGIVIAQHIPAEFSRAFAQRLNESCAIEVREAAEGDAVRDGLALVAPGNFHMLLRGGSGRFFVTVKSGPRVAYQRPSVDVLFLSVAETAGSHAVGVLLTGMGSDGAQGMLKMRQNGAHTIAQDEATCVVFGMPREAIAAGAAERVLPLNRIANAMLSPGREQKAVAPKGQS